MKASEIDEQAYLAGVQGRLREALQQIDSRLKRYAQGIHAAHVEGASIAAEDVWLGGRIIDSASTAEDCTAHMAKGLEFDQVIIPGASDENYQSSMDRSLLYVACSRAMHRLTLTYTGEQTRLIEE